MFRKATDRTSDLAGSFRGGPRALAVLALTTLVVLVAPAVPAQASATLAASVSPATPGSVSLSLTTDLSTATAAAYPAAQLSSVTYTLPAEFSSQLSQASTTCDPSSFMSLATSVSGLSTGVSAPSSCATAIIGTASASGFAPAAGSAEFSFNGGVILATSGTYPLTLWLSYQTKLLGAVDFAFGGTVTQAGGQTVLTFDTDNAQSSTYAYGFPPTYSKYLAINGLTLDFPDSGGAFTATGCATGAWSFGETVSYDAAYDASASDYDLPAPPNDSASASVSCSALTTGGGGGDTGDTGVGSGTSGSSTGSSGVSGSTTTVPSTSTPSKKPAVAECVVPSVKSGATLSSVETLLKRAHCAVGKIATKPSANVTRKGKIVSRGVPKGRVIGLADKAGTKLKANTRIGITVSRG